MKTSVHERYVVASENYGSLEGSIWCETLQEARKQAAEMRNDMDDPEERHAILILKVLRV